MAIVIIILPLYRIAIFDCLKPTYQLNFSSFALFDFYKTFNTHKLKTLKHLDIPFLLPLIGVCLKGD
jgi:hypothetical protein